MPSDVQPQLLRRMNARRLLETLRTHGPCSRADLMRHSGISAPTVSKVVTDLLGAGLVEEGAAPRPSIGRPGRLLQLSARNARVLGVAIDAKQVKVVAAGFDGAFSLDDVEQIATPQTYDGLIDEIAQRAETLLAIPDSTLIGVGISTPGLIDHAADRVVLSPNVPITNGRQPAVDLARRLNIDCVMVQEANAHCLAEWIFGGDRSHDHFAVLDVATGLGLGVMVDGSLLTGSRGFAGEIGHTTIDVNGLPCGCGNRGCLETLATDSALVRRVAAERGRTLPIHELVVKVQRGELNIDAALDATCDSLAVAIGMVINIFNPTALFVHGQFLDAQPDLFDRVRERVVSRSLGPPRADCKLERTTTNKLQGAAAGILHHLTNSQGPQLR